VFELVAYEWDTLTGFLHTGGWVLTWILAAAAVLWTIVLERAWYLWRIYPRLRASVLAQWSSRPEHQSWASQRVRLALISQLRVGLENGLPIIRVMVPMSPLLGLLGTVTGMLEVFDAMAFRSGADTRAMADGISHAMIATMAGLVVSIIALFFINLFQSRVQAEVERLNDLIAPG
jgi:biopolymer transport protein ExbB